jgi:hypothetical protein
MRAEASVDRDVPWARRVAARATLLAAGLSLLAAVPPASPADPLLPHLAEDEYEAAWPELRSALQRLDDPCRSLGVYAAHRNDRVREHSVKALGDWGCARFSSYEPYLSDRYAWVVEAIVRAVERHAMGEAVPFLLDRIGDARRILDGTSPRTIGEMAHRALRRVTCQSFHYDSAGTPESREIAVETWRRWYAGHRRETRAAWVDAGVALASGYVGHEFPPYRLEGLRLLALIGPPAVPALRAALERRTADLLAGLSCQIDDPPRVTDEITCLLLVQNASRRRVALAPAPDSLRVEISRIGAPPPARAPATDGREPAGRDSGAALEAILMEIESGLVDLAPGEILRRELKVGPVPAAGRYEIRATLVDRAAWLPAPRPVVPPGPASAGRKTSGSPPRSGPGARAAAAPPAGSGPAAWLPAIEATTILRFEQ